MKQLSITMALIFFMMGLSFSQNSTLSISPVCEGDNLILIVIDPVAGATNHIIGPNGFSKSTTMDTIVISPAKITHNGSYSLNVQPPSGTLVSGGTATAIIYPKPDIVITASSICVGSQATLTATDNHAENMNSYQWNLGGSTQTGSTVSFFPNSEMKCFVTATSSHGCIGYDTINLTYTGKEQVKLSSNPACESTPLTVVPSESGATFSWNTGEKTPVVYPVIMGASTIYTVTYTASNGCLFVLSAEVKPKPTANFVMDKNHAIIADGFARINFEDYSIDAVQWHWDFGDVYSAANNSYIRSPYHDFTEQGEYRVLLTARSFDGCTDTVSKLVTIAEPFSFFIPNTFSPNGDGINDQFCVQGTGFIIENFYMRIYDRHNTLLYKSEYIYDCWDGRHGGKNCPQGVYIGIIKVTTSEQEVKEYITPITLLR